MTAIPANAVRAVTNPVTAPTSVATSVSVDISFNGHPLYANFGVTMISMRPTTPVITVARYSITAL